MPKLTGVEIGREREYVNSQIDEALLESIVAGVLDRLRGGTAPAAPARSEVRNPKSEAGTAGSGLEPVFLPERVVTEAVLEVRLNGSKAVRFKPKAILTPSARDYLRVNGIEWAYSTPSSGERKTSGGAWATLIVRTTPAVERAVADVLPGVRQELFGCPDDASAFAIAEIARGGLARALIFAEQSHRAACLANRHVAVKAVAVRDAADVAVVRKQLRASVWCVDPSDRSYFELRNLLKAIKAD